MFDLVMHCFVLTAAAVLLRQFKLDCETLFDQFDLDGEPEEGSGIQDEGSMFVDYLVKSTH
jgi:hypothetical protein